jgi:hypothetical protein
VKEYWQQLKFALITWIMIVMEQLMVVTVTALKAVAAEQQAFTGAAMTDWTMMVTD